MFGLLRKKLEGFTQKLKEKVFERHESKPGQVPEAIEEKPAPQEKALPVPEEKAPEIAPEKPIEIREAPEKIHATLAAEKTVFEQKPGKAEEKIPEREKAFPAEPKAVTEVQVKSTEHLKPAHAIEKETTAAAKKTPAHETRAIPGTPEEELAKPAEELHEAAEPHDVKGRELRAKVSLGGKLKSFFTGTVTVSEKEISGLLEELELALLEADVEPETAERVCAGIKKELAGKKIDRNGFEEAIKAEIRKSLLETMAVESIDICAMAKSKAEKPFVVLFLGPNGAGKTTTIAKIAHYLKKRGLESVLAASDTFRAASIEQIGVHAERLGLRVVKHNYGSDPAAVAFDAVQAAKAKGIPVVLVDSAGRQETNKNLMKEIEKIVRVVKPDLKLFVGEALAGHSLIEQAREFDKAVGLDGFVLTKIDTDAKGGTTISLIYNLKKPVVFIGTGQGYDDLLEFRPEFIVDRAVA